MRTKKRGVSQRDGTASTAKREGCNVTLSCALEFNRNTMLMLLIGTAAQIWFGGMDATSRCLIF